MNPEVEAIRVAVIAEIPPDRQWVLTASVIQRSGIAPKVAWPVLADLACDTIEVRTIDGHQWCRMREEPAPRTARERENGELVNVMHRAQEKHGIRREELDAEKAS